MGRRLNGQINGQQSQTADITVEQSDQDSLPLIIDSQGTLSLDSDSLEHSDDPDQ